MRILSVWLSVRLSVCLSVKRVQCNKTEEKSVQIFSERELKFMFTMSSSVRLSVVCLSVTLVHPTQAIEIFGDVSTP